MTFEDAQQFGLYELEIYAVAYATHELLVREKKDVIDSLYDDISPTMTGVDHETGLFFVQSTYPDTMAIKIIDEKERYDTMINREKRKAELFEMAMDSLTDRELDVIRVYYRGHKNNLGLSVEYFQEILESAQTKICSFIGEERVKQTEWFKKERKEALRRSIHAS